MVREKQEKRRIKQLKDERRKKRDAALVDAGPGKIEALIRKLRAQLPRDSTLAAAGGGKQADGKQAGKAEQKQHEVFGRRVNVTQIQDQLKKLERLLSESRAKKAEAAEDDSRKAQRQQSSATVVNLDKILGTDSKADDDAESDESGASDDGGDGGDGSGSDDVSDEDAIMAGFLKLVRTEDGDDAEGEGGIIIREERQNKRARVDGGADMDADSAGAAGSGDGGDDGAASEQRRKPIVLLAVPPGLTLPADYAPCTHPPLRPSASSGVAAAADLEPPPGLKAVRAGTRYFATAEQQEEIQRLDTELREKRQRERERIAAKFSQQPQQTPQQTPQSEQPQPPAEIGAEDAMQAEPAVRSTSELSMGTMDIADDDVPPWLRDLSETDKKRLSTVESKQRNVDAIAAGRRRRRDDELPAAAAHTRGEHARSRVERLDPIDPHPASAPVDVTLSREALLAARSAAVRMSTPAAVAASPLADAQTRAPAPGSPHAAPPRPAVSSAATQFLPAALRGKQPSAAPSSQPPGPAPRPTAAAAASAPSSSAARITPFTAAVNIAPDVDIAGVTGAEPLLPMRALRPRGESSNKAAKEVDSFVNELDALAQAAGDDIDE